MMVSWHEMTFLMYGGPTQQTFASFASNVCGEKTPFVESLPLMFFC